MIPAAGERGRRVGRFFWNRNRQNQGRQNAGNAPRYQQQNNPPTGGGGRQNVQNQNIGRNYIGQITPIAQGYEQFIRTILAGGNGNIPQGDIRLFSGRLRSWIVELSNFSNNINRNVQNSNEKTQILKLTRIVVTMFTNTDSRLTQNVVTYDLIANTLNRPNNFIQSRLRNIITLLQGI